MAARRPIVEHSVFPRGCPKADQQLRSGNRHQQRSFVMPKNGILRQQSLVLSLLFNNGPATQTVVFGSAASLVRFALPINTVTPISYGTALATSTQSLTLAIGSPSTALSVGGPTGPLNVALAQNDNLSLQWIITLSDIPEQAANLYGNLSGTIVIELIP